MFGWSILRIAAYGYPEGRMSSVFSHANTYAGYLVIVVVLSFCFMLETLDRNKRSPVDQGRIQFLFSSIIFISALLSSYLTSSRGLWGVIIIALFIISVFKTWRVLSYVILSAFAAVMVASYGKGVVTNESRAVIPFQIWGRVSDAMYPNRPYEMTRLAQIQYAWQLTLEKPLTGWGMQSFGPLYEAYSGLWMGVPHNLVLLFTSAVGIPATLLFFALVGLILVQATMKLFSLSSRYLSHKDLYFSLILSFSCLVVFNMANPVFFDLRVNTIGWTILAAITGTTFSQDLLPIQGKN